MYFTKEQELEQLTLLREEDLIRVVTKEGLSKSVKISKFLESVNYQSEIKKDIIFNFEESTFDYILSNYGNMDGIRLYRKDGVDSELNIISISDDDSGDYGNQDISFFEDSLVITRSAYLFAKNLIAIRPSSCS